MTNGHSTHPRPFTRAVRKSSLDWLFDPQNPRFEGVRRDYSHEDVAPAARYRMQVRHTLAEDGRAAPVEPAARPRTT